ncbi:MAG: OsmC family protein [Anaerolineae bacterium]|nr:OsmC family protein [Anaerolineae bacterium]
MPTKTGAESSKRSVRVRWLGGYRTETDIHGVHLLLGDETPRYGGEDTGPMPTEMLLVAVGTCMCLSVVHLAHKRHISVGRVTLETSAKKDDKAFRFRSIQVVVYADLPQEQLEPLVNLARRYCFVSNTLAEGCPVDVSVQSIVSVEQSNDE